MALFGKKKKPEQAAPPAQTQDEISVAGDDADDFDANDNGAQAIDFDAIADELDDDNGTSAFAATAATPFDDAPDSTTTFAPTANLESDDELDFNTVFEDNSSATAPATTADADNPFDADLDEASLRDLSVSGPIAIEPIAVEPTRNAPLTHTAPLLTSDAVATAGVPSSRRSFPLPMLLGAIGLLIALGAVGYLVTRGKSGPETAPIVATNPPLRASQSGATLVNLAASVDGVPIAPGAVGAAPALSGPKPTVLLTPALLKQLKALWNQGAAAKKRGDIAGARAAWTKMLQLRPNHPLVQSAIDKLPPA